MTEDEKPGTTDDQAEPRRGRAAAERYGRDFVRRKEERDREARAAEERERQLQLEHEEAAKHKQAGPATKRDHLPAVTEAEDKVLLTWRVHLLSRNRKTATWLTVVLAAGLSVVWISFHSLGWVILSAVLLLGSISTYILPVTYTLTEQEVRMRSLVSSEAKPWKRFTTYYTYPDAVHLAFDNRTFRGRVLRGYTLYFSGNREQVTSLIREKIHRPKD